MYFLLYICPVKSDRKEQLCVYPFIFMYIIIVPRLFSAWGRSQRKLTSYQKYISKYSDLAIQHQKKYRIPASITLAQGLLESGAGQSDLARRSNNHFGIKCHSDWRGGRVYHRRRPAGRVLPEIQTSRGFLWWPFPLPRRTLPLRTPVQIKHQGLQRLGQRTTKMRLRHRSCLRE